MTSILVVPATMKVVTKPLLLKSLSPLVHQHPVVAKYIVSIVYRTFRGTLFAKSGVKESALKHAS